MLVSIIVPVYKAEKWLHRCIDSILAQTMPDFELLLIDDGSPDRSGAICDEYAAKDPRVRVFHKPNGGVSSARNLGLDHAQGEWISFIDADDWVELDYLAGLTENLDADFITGGMRDTQGGVCVAENRLYSNSEIKEFIEQYNGNHFVRAVGGKLLRREIIEKNNIRFDANIRFGEDTFFNKQVLLNSDTVRIVNRDAYIYYIPSDVSGIAKYSLKLDEIEYIIAQLCKVNNALNAKFTTENLWHDVHYLLVMYDLNEVLLEGDKRLFVLYQCGFQNNDYKTFCVDINHSPIIKGILKLKEMYKSNNSVDIKKFYNLLENYCKSTPWQLDFGYKSLSLWYFWIKCRTWFLFDILMRFNCKFR